MTAALLPNAKAQFIDSTGKPLVGGKVYFYIPNTSTLKDTYQDAAQTILNTNPVVLDANGQAIIWGVGTYRQVVYDQYNNLIWDQITEDITGGFLGNFADNVFVAGTDFTPGTTNQLTLAANYGSVDNLWVFFDGVWQGPDQLQSLVGNVLTFASPIPVGVGKVYVKGGTTTAIGTPSNGTVTDATVAPNAGIQSSKLSFTQSATGAVARTVQNKLQETMSPKDFGAKGDGVTDDTAALQAWLNALSTNNVKGILPKGTYLTGGLLLPSNVYIQGDDMFNSIIRAKNGLNANLITSTSYATTDPLNGNTNIVLSNFTIDANGSNQTTGAYPLSIQYVRNLEISRLNMINPYGTLLWVSQSDNLGTGPGGRVAAPYGQYFNFNVYIHDCIFNGTGQIQTNADLNVIGSTQNSRIERNQFIGGGANCFSYQFARAGVVRDNVFSTFMRGLFVESCFECAFENNDFSTAGVRSPLTPGAWYNGIWLASANESYGTSAGFACSSSNVVDGNRFHDFNVSDSTNPIVAIRTSGYGGALSSDSNLIANNRVTNWWNTAVSTPVSYHILLEGQCNNVRVTNNICDGNGTGAGSIGIYLTGLSYGSVAQGINCAAQGNIVSNINTGIYQLGSSQSGTSIVGNTLNACTQTINVANPGQANYVASANN